MYDEASAPATAQTVVRLELKTSGAGFPALTTTVGTDEAASTTGNAVLTAADEGGGVFAVALEPGGSGWVDGGELKVAVMVETQDAVGASAVGAHRTSLPCHRHSLIRCCVLTASLRPPQAAASPSTARA